jgi:hypothetical protein
MGTRSTIALEFADGTVQAVYCHWDGYLSNNGKILLKHYSDPFKLRDLIDLGGFSSLEGTVEATAEKAYTQRGEDISIQKFKDIEDYYANVSGEEYDYILNKTWDGKAQWYVRSYATKGNWVPLELAFEHEREEA